MAKIISGTSIQGVAQRVSDCLGCPCLKTEIKRFSDLELKIELSEPVYGETVILVQSTCQPANDHIIELCLLADAAKRAGATQIIALMPYFGYARQDKLAYERSSISARLIATLLEASGISKVITLDLHSKPVEGFFNIPLQNIDPIPLLMKAIEPASDWVVISPDMGSLSRAQKLADKIGCDIALINKKRHSYPFSNLNNVIIGNVKEKNCLIIDDILDTGVTLSHAAFLLKRDGATQVHAMITHAVLSPEALFILESTPIEKIIITDSIPQDNLPPYFEILDSAPLLALAIQRFLS